MKRFLAAFLTMCMLCSLVPSFATAEEPLEEEFILAEDLPEIEAELVLEEEPDMEELLPDVPEEELLFTEELVELEENLAPQTEADKMLTAYVERCYSLILGRQGDEEGIEYWMEALKSGAASGADIVDGFCASPEFVSKGMSNQQVVELLYRTMMDREPDSEGVKYWLGFLNDGMSIHFVINGFAYSDEFNGICDTYGIRAGSVPLEDRDRNPSVTAFVNRCYRIALGRDGDPDGLNSWMDKLLNGTLSAQEVSYAFLFSAEFEALKTDNEEFVNRLYRLYMDRTPDAAGKASWVNQLKRGVTRKCVAQDFANSGEFEASVKICGLDFVREPHSLKEIGDSTFEGVPLNRNYDILYGIEKIGSRAFVGTGVEMVWLPKTLQYIAPDAFDKGTAFTCSPGTYAEKWCLENGMDFDYIKPYLDADSTSLLYGETATLSADYVFSKEPTEYLWEMRERERYWTPILDENGPVLRYTNTEGLGFIRFRVSAIVDGVASTPSDSVTISRYSDNLSFWPDRCKAVSGDAIYLEWGFLGKDKVYELYQWALNPQLEEGGEWISIDSFKGGWYRTVYGLDPNTEYSFMLEMIDEDEGILLSSNPITITTGAKKTSFEMREFSCEGRSVKMGWEPIHNAVYDAYYGKSKDELSLVVSSRRDTFIALYDACPVGETRYLQVRARIPGTGYEYWGPVIEVTATEEGPNLKFENYEVHGDVVNLEWTPMYGCVFDVYLSIDGKEETCIAEGISKNYLDMGGFEPGQTATFRVQARCGDWSNTTPTQTITFETADDVAYRALLIGEVNFRGSMYAARNYLDVEMLTEMLENVKTPTGSHYSVTRLQDLSREGILHAIGETFRNADDNDISLLFIATHGDVSYTGRFAGSLTTIEIPRMKHGSLLMEDLAAELEKIKGTKIVWLGSCGSGSSIYDPAYPDDENISEYYYGDYDEEEWGDEWYDYDPNDSLYLDESADFYTGELRLPGFQVLTAARYRFTSWGMPGDKGNYFTQYIVDGLNGPDGSMPADMNQDGTVTQHELFLYIKLREDDPETGVYQDVQAYPFNSDYSLFSK